MLCQSTKCWIQLISVDLLLRATNELQTVGHLTRQTTNAIEQALNFDDNILYAILHESIYCQGYVS